MIEPLELDGRHWRFAVDLYGKDGVSQACLALQDRFGVDVIVLMISLFGAVALGKAPGKEDIERMDAAIGPWRRSVVHPLRGVRRHLKTAGMGEAAERLREIIKSSELRSEQIELATLAPLIDQFSGRAPENRGETLDLIALISQFYAQEEWDRNTSDLIAASIAEAIK